MFTIKRVINAEELEVEPFWEWDKRMGNKVIVFGYATPKPGMYGYEFALKKLRALVEGRQVDLFSPQFYPSVFGYDKLVCRVYLDGVDISNYFPEFKSRNPGFV